MKKLKYIYVIIFVILISALGIIYGQRIVCWLNITVNWNITLPLPKEEIINVSDIGGVFGEGKEIIIWQYNENATDKIQNIFEKIEENDKAIIEKILIYFENQNATMGEIYNKIKETEDLLNTSNYYKYLVKGDFDNKQLLMIYSTKNNTLYFFRLSNYSLEE